MLSVLNCGFFWLFPQVSDIPEDILMIKQEIESEFDGEVQTRGGHADRNVSVSSCYIS